MSAMPDTGVIVTGAVGAAGIAGTLLSARLTARSHIAGLKLSTAAEEERAHLAEKRRIYAGFHTSIDRLIVDWNLMHEGMGGAGPDEREELKQVPDAAMMAMSNSLSEIKLIAPEPVGRQAEKLARLFRAISQAILSERDGAELDAIGSEIFRQRSALYEAMRADLEAGRVSPG
jgi:hypothetical protein